VCTCACSSASPYCNGPAGRAVALCRRPPDLDPVAQPGESVLGLFGGSGSTLIACEQSGRRA